MLQQIKLEAERSKSPEAKMKRKKSRECMGDMGAALFHPLNYDDEQHVDEQRAAILRNTEQFVRGLPANNVLLTGARGTGKSSLI